MTRRVCLWAAVCSLSGLAAVSVVSSVAGSYASWTYYTPGSATIPNRAMQVMNACAYAEMILVPLAALASAGYMLLLDRAVRHDLAGRGFEVRPMRGSE